MKIGIICYASVGGSGVVATELAHALAGECRSRGFAARSVKDNTEYVPAIEMRRAINATSLMAVPDRLDRGTPGRLRPTLVLSGDRTKAKTAYEDALTLWKEADSAIPIVDGIRQPR